MLGESPKGNPCKCDVSRGPSTCRLCGKIRVDSPFPKPCWNFGHSWGYRHVREFREDSIETERSIGGQLEPMPFVVRLVIRWWECANLVTVRQKKAPEAATGTPTGLRLRAWTRRIWEPSWSSSKKRAVRCSCNWCWCECSSCIEHKCVLPQRLWIKHFNFTNIAKVYLYTEVMD